VFTADMKTIGFVNALLTVSKKAAIIVDTKETPIEVSDLKEFLDLLVGAYTESTNEYKIQIDKLNKARNIKTIMDW
jgi:hypothetical protein